MDIEFDCDECSKKCSRPHWEYNKVSKHYCSQSCAKSYRNKNSSEIPNPGDKKNSLTFIKHYSNERNQTWFECLCDCGEKHSIQRSKFGTAKNCGKRERHKGSESVIYKGYKEISSTYWNSIKHGAKTRNLEFNITIEYAWSLWINQNSKCALSGIDLNLSKNYNKEVTASLDRKDSTKGYIEGNIQWVHKDVNVMKMALDEKYFINICNAIKSNCEKIKLKLNFEDVLISPQKTELNSRSEVDLKTNKLSHIFPNTIPIIAANMSGTGCFSVAKCLAKYNMMTCLHKYYTVEEYVDFFQQNSDIKNKIFFSVGANEKDFEKLTNVYEKTGIKNVCLDVANAYCPQTLDYISKIRSISKDFIIMAGNIATPDMIEDLSKAGTNIIKCGIGSGSVCETRDVAGIGIPQLSCIIDCVEEAGKNNVYICSDGGIKRPADISIAFGAGASMVMVGGLLAGHNECEGEWTYENIPKYIGGPHADCQVGYEAVKKTFKFYGMSSKYAMEKYHDGVAEYRASEGKCVEIPYKGELKYTIGQILGGLRSTCTYINSKTLKDISDNTTFVRVK